MAQTKQEWEAQWDAEHMEPVTLKGRILLLDTSHQHRKESVIQFNTDDGNQTHQFFWLNSKVDALFAQAKKGDRGTLTINNWYYQVPIAFSKE